MKHIVRLASVVLTVGLAGGCTAGGGATPTDGITASNAAAISVGAGRGRVYARGLYNHDGTASFTVATGWMDGWWADLSTIRAVSAQVQNASGVVVDSQSFPSVDTSLAFNFLASSAAHGDPWTINATVQSIYGDRPIEVTVSGSVVLRPAVIVAPDRGIVAPDRGIVAPDRGIVAPDQPIVGLPALVSVDMSETNRETGAVLDCVLTINGAELARNTNMFVPAGSTEDCQFVTTFEATGDYNVAVSVQNIKPAEDVVVNNDPNVQDPHTVTQVVHIVAPDHDFGHDHDHGGDRR